MPRRNVDKAKLLEAKNAAQVLLNLLENDEPFLNGAVTFDVVSDESNPHKVHYLHVTITNRGIKMETVEHRKSDRQTSEFTWDELMNIGNKCRTIQELDDEINEMNCQLRDQPPTLTFG